ncbi:MAG: 2-succinyl-5-enolpyruvyl-6-hydroxy-3-cyclohexene-1-carboxylic-acid synthase [Parachlamydiales bacterium]|nr:2-succinyl-5-enolpyruvyl-6-hydroxy-3-cyclohexene-1-carboxylic-acid synthase [Parachlamydiales bacterium]
MIESWMIDQLAQQGVAHFCLAPGSRSTPLALAAIEHPKAETHVHFDERGLGFLALGIAKASQKPVALIVTSGTAVGNLLPAVMEAHHTNTPLILVTADRPHELRDCSANQTTDQVKIFQSFVRWQTDLPTEMDEKFFRSAMAQAYFASMKNPPGPVHINCPLRDPLYRPDLKIVEGKPFQMTLPRHAIDAFCTHKSRGAILIGRLPDRKDVLPILDLAKRLQWPVLADILSNARCYPTPNQVRYFDYIEKPTPDFVLHFGEKMTSKRILEWLKKIRPEMVHVSPYPELQDPERILTGRVQADILEFCDVFEANTAPDWLESWKDQEPEFEESGAFTEVHAMRKIGEVLPPDFGAFFGNGMPIRDADHFLFPKAPKAFFSNRGLSGIDGNIATIAGLANEMPMLGIIGDQAALYDLNSLPLIQKAKYPVILIISNNFGGGIFHHLPIASSPHFEKYWAFAHDLGFEKAAEMFRIPYGKFDALAFDRTMIIELITDRNENARYQKSFQSAYAHK